MAITMETGHRLQYETIKRTSSGEKHPNMETFYSKQTGKNNSVKKSTH